MQSLPYNYYIVNRYNLFLT